VDTPVSRTKEIAPRTIPDAPAGSGTVALQVPVTAGRKGFMELAGHENLAPQDRSGIAGAPELSRSRTVQDEGDAESQYPSRVGRQRIGRQRRGAIAVRRLGRVREHRRPRLVAADGGRSAGDDFRLRWPAPGRRPVRQLPRGIAVREELQT